MKLTSRRSLSLLTGALLTLLLLAAAGLIIMYSGAYNVAASVGHSRLVRWAAETTMRNSVETRAPDIEASPPPTAVAIAAGGANYKAMCQHCHGGPGAQRAEWVQGMVPRPPDLSRAAREWQRSEIFWIVKHGIKMSGMPAFGATHDEQTAWNIASFVDALPNVTPEEYAAIPSRHGGSSADSKSDHSSHSH